MLKLLFSTFQHSEMCPLGFLGMYHVLVFEITEPGNSFCFPEASHSLRAVITSLGKSRYLKLAMHFSLFFKLIFIILFLEKEKNLTTKIYHRMFPIVEVI